MTTETFGEKTAGDPPRAGNMSISVSSGTVTNSGNMYAVNRVGANGIGGTIEVVASGNVANSGVISVDTHGDLTSGGEPVAGTIRITSSGGSIANSSDITAINRQGANGDGGTIVLTAQSGITNTDEINLDTYGEKSGTGFPQGGTLTLTITAGSLSNSGSITSVSRIGSNGRGGSLTFSVAGNFTNSGSILADTLGPRATGGTPDGGTIVISVSNGNFNFPSGGSISASSLDTTNTGGTGGTISITVNGGNLTSAGGIYADAHDNVGASPQPQGGTIALTTSGLLRVSGKVYARAVHKSQYNGTTTLSSGTRDLSGSDFQPQPTG
jgi:hypothetical protein